MHGKFAGINLGNAAVTMFAGLREFPNPTVANIPGYYFAGDVAPACAYDPRAVAKAVSM